MKKLHLLKEIMCLQARREDLWFQADNIVEALLQQELRNVAWMIEEASEEKLEQILENYAEEYL